MKKILYLMLVLSSMFVTELCAKSFIREYTYNASEADSKISSRTIALDQIKTILLQEIGVYIRSEITVTKDGDGNSFASEDVEAITAGLTKVDILEEKWNGETYYLKAKIEADTEQVLIVLEEIKIEKSKDSILRLEKLKDNKNKLNEAREEVIRLRKKLSKFTNNNIDKEKVIEEYIRQVEKVSLYDMYENGSNYDKRGQYEDAVFWYLKAANQGDAEAQNRLGVMFFIGQGVKKDLTEAASWFEKSASQGNTNAYVNYGHTLTNYPDRFKWYKKAALAGHQKGQLSLGGLYEKGRGVKQDYTEAIFWYEKSAKQGNSAAQNKLGAIYYKGKGVEQDYEKAVYWFNKSAKQGDKMSQYYLAEAYYSGNGIDRNYGQAAFWYKKAAKQGDASSQNKLGFMHYTGQGVTKNYAKALSWYRWAAKQNYWDAYYNIGYMYKKGQGVEMDEDIANEWYDKACDGGYKPACLAQY